MMSGQRDRRAQRLAVDLEDVIADLEPRLGGG